MMQEYFNIDIESNFSLGDPQEINRKGSKSSAAILPSRYQDGESSNGPITIMTPPLRCTRVRVWPGKNNKYSKCVIELETTENEWRFTQFLTDLGNKCRYVITEHARDWFRYAFSASAMRDTYNNLFVQKNYKRDEEEKIEIQLGKLLLNDLDKQTAKSYRNQYLVLRLVFKGVLVSNGVFSEVWRADQIFKARPSMNDSDESDYDDDYYEDIGETVTVKSNVKSNDKSKQNIDEKEIKTNKTIKQQSKEKVKVEKLNKDGSSDEKEIKTDKENNANNENEEDSKTVDNSESVHSSEPVTLTINEVDTGEDNPVSNPISKQVDNQVDNQVTDVIDPLELQQVPKAEPEAQIKVEDRKDVEVVVKTKKPKKKKTRRKKKIIISNNRRRKW